MINTIKNWLTAINEYPSLLKEYNKTVTELTGWRLQYKKLEMDLLFIQGEEDLENYWNNKRVKVNRQWKARDGVSIDLRCFFQRDCTLPTFTGTDDEKAKKALGYAISNLQYVSDTGEFWQYAYETHLIKTGDCEDGAIYIANMMINSGIPYWKIRLNKGWVKYGRTKTYHAWCTYLADDDDWYCLDWCYYPRKSANLGLNWKNSEDYLTCDSSTNAKYSFGGLNEVK